MKKKKDRNQPCRRCRGAPRLSEQNKGTLTRQPWRSVTFGFWWCTLFFVCIGESLMLQVMPDAGRNKALGRYTSCWDGTGVFQPLRMCGYRLSAWRKRSLSKRCRMPCRRLTITIK